MPHVQHYHHPGGPGLGVRMNSGWQPPKMTPIRYGSPATTDREVAKLEKFKAILAEPDLNLGQWTGVLGWGEVMLAVVKIL